MNSLELRIIQINSGLKNKDFAEKIGVSLSTLEKWKAGTRNISKFAEIIIKSMFSEHVKDDNSNEQSENAH